MRWADLPVPKAHLDMLRRNLIASQGSGKHASNLFIGHAVHCSWNCGSSSIGASAVASHADAINDTVSATLKMILRDILVDVWKGTSVVQVQFDAPKI